MQKYFFNALIVSTFLMTTAGGVSAAEMWTAKQDTPENAVKTYFYAYTQKRFDLAFDTMTEKYAKTIGVNERPPTKEGDTATFELPADIKLEVKDIYKLTKGADTVGYQAIAFYDFDGGGKLLKNLIAPLNQEGGKWRVALPERDDKYFSQLKVDMNSIPEIVKIFEGAGEVKLEKMS